VAQGWRRNLGQSLLISQGGRRLSTRGRSHSLAGFHQRTRRAL